MEFHYIGYIAALKYRQAKKLFNRYEIKFIEEHCESFNQFYITYRNKAFKNYLNKQYYSIRQYYELFYDYEVNRTNYYNVF